LNDESGSVIALLYELRRKEEVRAGYSMHRRRAGDCYGGREFSVIIRSQSTPRSPVIMFDTSSLSSVRMVLPLLIIGVCFLGMGCRDVAIIWTAEAPSPDGQWLASARTEQHGGPGTAGVETIVYLKKISASKPPEAVLSFFHDPYLASQSGATINLTIKWATPTHLEVTYNGYAQPSLQIVKYGGVDVSVRDLSAGAASTPK